MKDASTSPRHPNHPAKYQRRSSLCIAPLNKPASSPLLALPLELLHRILEDATDDHPENAVRDKSSMYDPRDVGWWDVVTMEVLRGYTKVYHQHMLSLLLVCKPFYIYLLPRLYAQPVLVDVEALALFAEQCSTQPFLHPSSFGGLVKTFVLHPGSVHPTEEWVRAWKSYLPAILPQLSKLKSFVPGILTLHLSMDQVASYIPANNRITSLDQLDHYASLYLDTTGPSAELQHPSLSLMARCPALKRLSLSGINLLEQGFGMQQTSRTLLTDEERGEWRASDSVAERWLRVLRLGVAFGPDGEEGGGLESFLIWENSVMGVGVLREVLECLPKLRCLHLDVFTYLTPSPVESAFYHPNTKLLSLPALMPFLANLVELTFAPLFGDTIRFTGSLDTILLNLPHLLRLELRSDFITPSFLLHSLSPAASPIVYLALHILPPHNPAYRTSEGLNNIAVTVCLWKNREEVLDLLQRGCEVFALMQGGEEGMGESAVEWPMGAMEERRDASDETGWYELLIRLSVIAVTCRTKLELEDW